jgi:hypothetical protein
VISPIRALPQLSREQAELHGDRIKSFGLVASSEEDV